MNRTINSRIREVRKEFCDGSNTKFAKQLGKEVNTTSNWVREGYSVGGGVASEIASKFPVSIDWLLTGEGEMLKTEKESPDFQNANGSLYNIVPLWNFDAVGSLDKVNDVTDSPAYIEKYIAFPSARKDDFCVHVTGNSMIPTYCPGSLVLLREVLNWREYFGYGHCFMLFLNDGRRILKEVQKFVENPKEYITCVSHNKEFPSEELPKNMIMSVYKVIATLNNEGF